MVTRVDLALLGHPALSTGIWRVDAEVADLRDFHAPLAQDGEAQFVPIGIGDDVDGHFDSERTRKLEGLIILAERRALAELAQALVVNRLDAEEHVGKAERLPEAEHVLVAQQDVAAGLQVILLLDAGPGDSLADRQAMLGLDEGDVIDDEGARLSYRPEILDHAFRAHQPIAASVEGPGAAERAIPRTAARELDRAGRSSSRLCTKPGAGPSPSAVTAPGTPVAAPRSSSIASSSLTMPTSPSPLSTQSTAPSPCSTMACAVNEALCPPTQMKQRGSVAFVALARSTISGTLAR